MEGIEYHHTAVLWPHERDGGERIPPHSCPVATRTGWGERDCHHSTILWPNEHDGQKYHQRVGWWPYERDGEENTTTQLSGGHTSEMEVKEECHHTVVWWPHALHKCIAWGRRIPQHSCAATTRARMGEGGRIPPHNCLVASRTGWWGGESHHTCLVSTQAGWSGEKIPPHNCQIATSRMGRGKLCLAQNTWL